MDESFYWVDKKVAKNAKVTNLVEFDKNDDLCLQKKGAKVLSNLSKDGSLNLVSSLGHLRIGKSFLLNCIAGIPDVFPMGNHFKACTKGVDLCDVTLHHSWLANQVKVESFPNAPTIGWVDVGTADDPSDNVMLSLPFLLLSKVLIWNHKGAPTRHALLDELGVLAAMADYVTVTSSEAEKSAVKTATTPKKESATEQAEGEDGPKPKFGHLHCVFRDFTFSSSQEEVYQQLFGMEPEIITPTTKAATGGAAAAGVAGGKRPSLALPRRRSIFDAVSAEGGGTDKTAAAAGGGPKRRGTNRGSVVFQKNTGAVERNAIRTLLLSRFASITVWCFRQPSDPDTLQKNKNLPIEVCDPGFGREVRCLMEAIARQTIAPAMFLGSRITGPRLADLLKQFTHSLNTDGLIEIAHSQFEGMEKASVSQLADLVLADYEEQAVALKKNFPYPKEVLSVLLSGYTEKVKTTFAKQADGPRSAKNTVLEELLQSVAVINADVEKRNLAAVDLHVQMAIDKHAAIFRASFIQWCDENKGQATGAQVDAHFRSLKEDFMESVEGQLSVFQGVTKTKEFVCVLANTEERLQELLTLRTLQSDAVSQNKAMESLAADASRNATEKERLKFEKLAIIEAKKKAAAAATTGPH